MIKIKPNEYLDLIDKETRKAYDVASEIRKKGFDPEEKVDIPLVKDMAERVEGLVSAVVPEIIGKGIPERIKEIEKEYSSNDWRVALKISLEVSQGKFCSFKNKEKAIEAGIRVGSAYVTLGIVSAPLEGFLEAKIKKRKDGEEYLSCYFGGPIRAAGGTAAALTVLIADYVRRNLGIKEYDIEEKEVKRYIAEINDYHERVSRLQYFPSQEELTFLLNKIPVEITGDPTVQMEVSNYKDLPRIETNMVRGGMCLVVAEGLSQKAKKLNKKLSQWGKDMGLEDWASFLSEFLKIQETILAKGKKEEVGIKPNYRYLESAVAGRPVFSFPLRKGGFRIRYGHSRTNGLAAGGISPATMVVLDGFIATGTQLAIERPGKATAITVCDSIEGPIVRLTDGSVLKVETEEQAKKIKKDIQKILFLGDILFTYGEFFQNGHILIESGYVEEWWVQELKKATNPQALSEKTKIDIKKCELFFKEPLKTKPTDYEAYLISKEFGVPIHPRYTYFWHDIKKEDLIALCRLLQSSNIDFETNKIVLNKNENKRILEKLGLPQKVFADKIIIEEPYCFLASLGYFKENKLNTEEIEKNQKIKTLEILSEVSNFKTRAKCPIYLGCRMGRPEKAKLREMTGRPHVLFPCGQEGGRLRSFQSALEKKYVKADFPVLECPNCGKTTIYSICEICGTKTKKLRICSKCGKLTDADFHCKSKTFHSEKKKIDIAYYINIAKKRLKEELPALVKGVRGMSNSSKLPEPIEKGILRAKYGLTVNKDGTIRLDMIEVPITHFYPREVGTSVEKLRELGYETDVYGKILENENQLLELFPQDIILPECTEWEGACMSKVLINLCNFIDDLLVKFYSSKPFYNVKSKDDLIGQLVIGLAPHTSAGIVGRIIGFSKTQGYFAHPFFHCACRRNCDGDELGLILLMDAFLNFSRQFLPKARGAAHMDAPLVLTTKINPKEIDDEVHSLDIVWEYPLEFYEATLKGKYPWDFKMEQVSSRLGKENQFNGFGFTHDVSDINSGTVVSSYKTLKTMMDKVKAQVELGEKIRAVNPENIASIIINKHFLRDIKGNLRKYSKQEFRCIDCNEKYRRIPLTGKCNKCNGKSGAGGGKLVLTVAEGTVKKYLEPCLVLAKKYNLPLYLRQTLDILSRRIDSIFGRETEKQSGLSEFFK